MPLFVRDRGRHLDSFVCQMVHKVQIKWQFFSCQLLKESKYILTFISFDKKITVFNAGTDPFDTVNLPKRKG